MDDVEFRLKHHGVEITITEWQSIEDVNPVYQLDKAHGDHSGCWAAADRFFLFGPATSAAPRWQLTREQAQYSYLAITHSDHSDEQPTAQVTADGQLSGGSSSAPLSLGLLDGCTSVNNALPVATTNIEVSPPGIQREKLGCINVAAPHGSEMLTPGSKSGPRRSGRANAEICSNSIALADEDSLTKVMRLTAARNLDGLGKEKVVADSSSIALSQVTYSLT
ncbi:hypothetical protein E2562_038492 [Oryza meyeriana var. granulata]|uniref:Uncharacterized protein n=1 Tax=Oryza meyeriana var. granulata TaxID=110450 RepID=A0A6G1C156_9ORYZ|nr:hypothetical protein E2562_038492 [Oryza meyeriana var. granulata]